MKVDRVTCGSCESSFDFAENIGTTCKYVKYCPSCGADRKHLDIEPTEIAT